MLYQHTTSHLTHHRYVDSTVAIHTPALLHHHQAGHPAAADAAGLAINDAGLLVDEKSGKVINEFGATRWDVSVRALRGELDPPNWADNNELAPGVLLSSLVDFPTMHDFSIVAKAGVDKQAFVADIKQMISNLCQAPVEDDNCVIKERLGGKYVSMTVNVMVRAPEIIQMVWEELGKDDRVKMRY